MHIGPRIFSGPITKLCVSISIVFFSNRAAAGLIFVWFEEWRMFSFQFSYKIALIAFRFGTFKTNV